MGNIVCWNINSVKSRLSMLLSFLEQERPDVVLLQETKCMNDAFPRLEIEDLGYNLALNGQKSYNGVAILSKRPIEDIVVGLPNVGNEEARYIEAFTTVDEKVVRVASVYVPNGQSVGSDRFAFKLRFFAALNDYMAMRYRNEEPFFIGGDFNVALDNIDVYDSKELDGEIGFHVLERESMRKIVNRGYYDTFRIMHPKAHEFSWWDYRASSFQNDKGMRIDYILASPEAMDICKECKIYKDIRKLDKTSDHAPIGIRV